MKFRQFAYAMISAAVFGSAQNAVAEINLIYGHPIHDESNSTAGIAMGFTITEDQSDGPNFVSLCNELRLSAELGLKNSDGLNLGTVFIVPYKGMAVEGYYLSNTRGGNSNQLVSGKTTAPEILNGILTQVGIPPAILEELDIQQEISCQLDEPQWAVMRLDVSPIGDMEPEVVIERARWRFMALYQHVVGLATAIVVPSKITGQSR